MTTVSLKLPESLIQAIERQASRRGLSKSAVIRESLERILARPQQGTCLDRMRHLVGSQPGPADASSNPAHLASALLDNHERPRRRRSR